MEDKNLTALIEQAIKDSESTAKSRNNIQYTQGLTYWAVAYSVLGDKEAGNVLFQETLRTLDAQIKDDAGYAAASGESGTLSFNSGKSYASTYKEKVLYLQEELQNSTPFISLNRKSIVALPIEDVKFLHGMMGNYYQLLTVETGVSRSFIEDVANNGSPQPPPRVFQQDGLPNRIVRKARQLTKRYDMEWSNPLFIRECASLARDVYQEYANRLSANTT